MQRSSRQRLVMVVSGLVALAAVAFIVVTVVDQHRRDADNRRTPPPLGDRAPDVQRLRVLPVGPPDNPTGYVKRADGVTVGLGVEDTGKAPTPNRAWLYIRDEREPDTAPKGHLVKPGDTVTEYGVKVTVLKIWQMPNPDNDAMDVRADPV